MCVSVECRLIVKFRIFFFHYSVVYSVPVKVYFCIMH